MPTNGRRISSPFNTPPEPERYGRPSTTRPRSSAAPAESGLHAVPDEPAAAPPQQAAPRRPASPSVEQPRQARPAKKGRTVNYTTPIEQTPLETPDGGVFAGHETTGMTGGYPADYSYEDMLPMSFPNGYNSSMVRQAFFAPDYLLRMYQELTDAMSRNWRNSAEVRNRTNTTASKPSVSMTQRLCGEIGALVLAKALNEAGAHGPTDEESARQALGMLANPHLEIYLDAVRRAFPDEEPGE